jgi:pyridoxal phosphate enzyme (YggS family)
VSIADNVAAVEARIQAACRRAGRARDEITLVAVSKTFPAESISEALAAGVTNIGENRVQEARDKKPLVPAPARWHLIGHLQSNKAKDAVRLFDVIETLDSVDLAQKVARAAEADGKDRARDVLLEVNIGDEPQKSGVPPAEVESVVRAVHGMTALRLRGLMALPPVSTPEETRRYFRRLRGIRDQLGLEHVSMGMSEDFEMAIEEGSTIIRVGRAIFGERR